MSTFDLNAPARRSSGRTRSNPILESQIASRRAVLLREKEKRQYQRLLELQAERIPLFHLPTFHRIDGSALKRSEQRIGVVGLLVDPERTGLVTRIQVTRGQKWEIPLNLPFRPVHLQSLIDSLVSVSGLNVGLPELLAFKIGDTLEERMEGDSMDVACLLAIIDNLNGSTHNALRAAAAVVLHAGENRLRPTGSIPEKLQAFRREYGRGSLLVRAKNCPHAALFDGDFDEVWAVSNLGELADHLNQKGLLTPLLANIPLTHEHAVSLSMYLRDLLAEERNFPKVHDLIDRLKSQITDRTPPQMKLEIFSAEEDLHRHLGNFDRAIQVRLSRLDLERNPHVSSYQRMIDSDCRLAAGLYDAHRFEKAVDYLNRWRIEWAEKGFGICSPETRSHALNTLGRCLVILGNPEWESCIRDAMEIQECISPNDVSRTRNYLIHGLLKSHRVREAESELKIIGHGSDGYTTWLHAETARQLGITWESNEERAIHQIDPTFHVYGFALQAAARQIGRSKEQRIEYMRLAKECFSHGVQPDVPNVKTPMAHCCRLAIAVTEDDPKAVGEATRNLRSFLSLPVCHAFHRWYDEPLRRVESERNWGSVDALFASIPHL